MYSSSRSGHLVALVLIILSLAGAWSDDAIAGTDGDPVNRLDFSRVHRRSLATANTPTTPVSLEGPVLLSPKNGDVLEVRFIGAPRWLNEVSIRTDAVNWRVEFCGVEKEPLWSEFAGSLRKEADRTVLIGPDTYTRGIRFVPLSPAVDATWAQVELLDAAFRQVDPDDMRDGIAPLTEEGTKESHVGWSNDYPGTINDLTCSDDDAEELNNDLPSDWTTWCHADLNNHEVHYKSTAIGNGDNNDHTDAADLSFYVGHGEGGEFVIGNDTEDDDILSSSDAASSWGNNDMEWMGSVACQWLESSARAGWHDAMDGLHLICGSETNSRASPLYSYGGKWASKMKDSGAFDSPMTVKCGWFDAYEAENPSGNVAVVIGETSTQGSDYLWGEGSVSSDPVHDGSYSYWRYTASGLRPFTASKSDPSLSRSVEAITDAVSYRPEGGLPITVDRSLLEAPAIQLPYYMVMPANVDTPFVRQIAQAICESEGVLCGGDIGPGDDGEINLIDGMYELRVCGDAGSYTYDAAGRYLSWRTQPPNLPSPSVAQQLASQILAQWSGIGADAVFKGVRYVRQGMASHPNGEEIDDPQQSFPVSIHALYQRHLGAQQIPVEGGGGHLSVAFGHNGQLDRVFVPGWHPVMMGGPVSILPVQDVIQDIAARGSAATVDGITPPAQSATINGWYLAYYEPSCGVPLQRLRPIYVFNATVTTIGGNESMTEIYAWADARSPVPDITSPAGPIAVPFGSQVCVTGQSMGGVPPVTLRWKDDLGNQLGAGPSICFPAIMPPVGNHSEDDSVRTVALIARDALGSIATDILRIRILPGVSGVGSVAPAGFGLLQNSPNPFRGLTQITLSVPELQPNESTTLRIYDVAGRLVNTLVNGRLSPGDHSLTWDARDAGGNRVTPGIYFYEFRAGATTASRKLLVLE